VPALPSCLLEPLWDQFAALLPARETFVAAHPLGCHRRRIADRTVFEHVVLALGHGSGYERSPLPDVPTAPSDGVSKSGLSSGYPSRFTPSG
jgi:hypothetical protein